MFMVHSFKKAWLIRRIENLKEELNRILEEEEYLNYTIADEILQLEEELKLYDDIP